MHYDLLSVIYQCYLRDDFSYVEKIKNYFNSDNVSGVIANLYFMNREEMKEEIGEREIDVLEMFRVSVNLFKKYFPDTKALFSIEGCDYIKDTYELEALYNLGLRSILLVWNNPNKYGSGNRGSTGLTDLGRRLLHKAIELGIIIDMSHMNKNTFYDTIEFLKEEKKKGYSPKVIASHSNVAEVYRHERNLSSLELLALKEFDPILGLVSYSVFTGCKDTVDFKKEYLKHINYAVQKLGIDNVGVSTDDMMFATYFYGEKAEREVFNYKNVKSELVKLLKTKFNDEEINKILFRNVERKLFRRN